MQLKKKKRSSNHTCPAFRYEIQNNVLTVALQCICMCAETSLIGNIFLKPLKIRQKYTNQHFLTFLYRPCMPYPHSVLKNKILHSGKRILIRGINFQAFVILMVLLSFWVDRFSWISVTHLKKIWAINFEEWYVRHVLSFNETWDMMRFHVLCDCRREIGWGQSAALKVTFLLCTPG